jgi:vacuolar-type H+-ATPase subunit F/Vma7
MQAKAAVLGDSDFVMPFSTLGLDTYPVEAQQDSVSQNIEKILEQKYALIVVAENVAPLAQEYFDAIQNKALPCMVVVPFTTESQGFAFKSLGKVLKMATGIDIIRS